MNGYAVLIVNGDYDLCNLLQTNLEAEGYRVDCVKSAEEALATEMSDYNLFITEVSTGEISGYKMARVIRNKPSTASTPIIFLSSKLTENDRLTAFNAGADDFISIPFSVREFIARVKVIMKRIELKKPNSAEIIFYEEIKMNITNKQVLVDGNETQFTKTEFEILRLFLENKNRLFSREDLLKQLWSEDAFVLGRTIDVNITRIRHKIGKYDKHIVTKLGLGYYFEA